MDHDAVVLENRHLRVLVSLTRGGEILELRDKRLDLDVLWHAEAALPATPFVPTVNRPEGNYLDHFGGGWQEIFPSGGPPTTVAGAAFGQHGEVALLPWRCEVEIDSPECLRVRLWTLCRRYPFLVERWLMVRQDEAALLWAGRATNRSPMDLNVMWGHHIVFGPPFVSSTLRLLLPPGTPVRAPDDLVVESFHPGEQTWPALARDGTSSEGVASIPEAQNHLFVGPLTCGHAALVNDALGLGVALTWERQELPYVWCWSVNAGGRAYPTYGMETLLAVEPFTSPFMALPDASSHGLAPRVVGHGSLAHTVTCTLGTLRDTEDAALRAFEVASAAERAPRQP